MCHTDHTKSFNLVTFVVLAAGVWRPHFVVEGHGRLIEPPSRATMWRQGYPTPENYDDNQLFCGGVGVQYGENKGKCGVCGDPWNGPREHEAGGKYANGIIVRSYQVGQVIDVSVELTANHKGYFEFRLCPTDNPFERVTHSCLAKYPLKVLPERDVKYYVQGGEGYYGASQKIHLKVQLPRNVKCRACLLQWKYNAGNSWGVDPDGTGCIGCGNQEQFYGCSDIAIGHSDVVLGKPAVKHPWLFQEETDVEWHFGIVKYNNKTTEAPPPSSSPMFYTSNCCVAVMVFHLMALFLSLPAMF
ncbi:solute carrier family 25 (mitochondrial carrier protein) member 16 [Biomphalaria pfeifferi]|uniref:Solute carrier family 25 (Mitochondrial carrier protein) member 16 n=1 Tax=Biomphalaria pfeifferi TaxID=112525 RepID=A0AAD8BQK8_BIOPF|nr:solute carrier family 25 (mitochondrial carrier protein) member 16 [Biomphalaria pfeifferi]